MRMNCFMKMLVLLMMFSFCSTGVFANQKGVKVPRIPKKVSTPKIPKSVNVPKQIPKRVADPNTLSPEIAVPPKLVLPNDLPVIPEIPEKEEEQEGEAQEEKSESQSKEKDEDSEEDEEKKGWRGLFGGKDE